MTMTIINKVPNKQTNLENNIFNINYWNITSIYTIGQQLRRSYKYEISQASNLEIKGLNNYVNDRNSFQTIHQKNQKDYLSSSLDDFINQLTNNNNNIK